MVDREGLLYHPSFEASAEIGSPHQEFYRPASRKWDEFIRVGADDTSTWRGGYSEEDKEKG